MRAISSCPGPVRTTLTSTVLCSGSGVGVGVGLVDGVGSVDGVGCGDSGGVGDGVGSVEGVGSVDGVGCGVGASEVVGSWSGGGAAGALVGVAMAARAAVASTRP